MVRLGRRGRRLKERGESSGVNHLSNQVALSVVTLVTVWFGDGKYVTNIESVIL